LVLTSLRVVYLFYQYGCIAGWDCLPALPDAICPTDFAVSQGEGVPVYHLIIEAVMFLMVIKLIFFSSEYKKGPDIEKLSEKVSLQAWLLLPTIVDTSGTPTPLSTHAGPMAAHNQLVKYVPY
jgi:hypothetical protein